MRRLTSIVALNSKGAIGCRNALPWRLRTDMSFFRQQTLGHVVIMGRKTFDSLGRKPLPGRFNVIVSHNFGLFEESEWSAPATGIAEALAVAENAPRKFSEIFVVGGQTMYEQFAPIVDRYFLTVVDKVVEGADTFFSEDLIRGEEWESRAVMAVDAVDGIDEASFTITEMSRERTEQRMEQRCRMVAEVKRPRLPSAPPRRSALECQPVMSAFL